MENSEKKIRKPAVEGRFYPVGREKIIEQIKTIEEERKYPVPEIDPSRAIGAVLPHAGINYSGHQTIPVFKLLGLKISDSDTIVIINPNHTGRGPAISLDPHSAWKNSLGELEIDSELGDLLSYPADASAQQNEHSAEVILPFIQYYAGREDLKILPICMRDQTYIAATQLAEELHEAIQTSGKRVLIFASSDFSHFKTPENGFADDQKVLDHILNMFTPGIEMEIRKNQISICGYGPIMTLMSYSELKCNNYVPEIIARGHSGEVHPSREVVDYISILFSCDENN